MHQTKAQQGINRSLNVITNAYAKEINGLHDTSKVVINSSEYLQNQLQDNIYRQVNFIFRSDVSSSQIQPAEVQMLAVTEMGQVLILVKSKFIQVQL
jgi:hypothetical protein